MWNMYGSEASARETPKSFCSDGKITVMMYMLAPPMVPISSATPRRIHA